MIMPLGQIVSTQGARTLCGYKRTVDLLQRHQRADWGELSADDKQANDDAMATGDRVLSAYSIDPLKPCQPSGENTIWIITEGPADKRVTTVLLPCEY